MKSNAKTGVQYIIRRSIDPIKEEVKRASQTVKLIKYDSFDENFLGSHPDHEIRLMITLSLRSLNLVLSKDHRSLSHNLVVDLGLEN
jgi:hypothetical protein